jgi:aspartyl-tRNA(Asn)/glutamyl-tRNA(Gln) amidotransferase subunit B
MENTNYDVIIGLEIHIQTKTKSKMFCTCPTGYFNKPANTHVCPVCMGLPGALPIPNKRALELCMLMGMATNCKIDSEIYFDRKHYFYPDLPKGYQISQYKRPICSDGNIDCIYAEPGKETEIFNVEIERIHQEEDVAKSTHHTENHTGKEYSLIDYNKSGVALIEIVTKPTIRSAKEAFAFASEIRNLARYLGVSDADMEKGQMRCEPNISVQEKGKWEYKDGMILPIGNYELNPKVEVKNIGSISAVQKSIEYEVERLIKEIENGNEIIQQTRGWNADKGITEFQRSKETADDYRYMAEPDIPVIDISEEDMNRVKSELEELGSVFDKYLSYKDELEISDYDAYTITRKRESIEYFETLLKELENTLETKEAAKEASNWLLGTIYAIANEKGLEVTNENMDVKDIAFLITKFKEKVLTKNKAEEILKDCIENNKDISDTVEDFEKEANKNSGNLEEIIKDILDKNPQAVDDFKNGKQASIGFLIGQVMQATKGSANPNDVRTTLLKELE